MSGLCSRQGYSKVCMEVMLLFISLSFPIPVSRHGSCPYQDTYNTRIVYHNLYHAQYTIKSSRIGCRFQLEHAHLGYPSLSWVWLEMMLAHIWTSNQWTFQNCVTVLRQHIPTCIIILGPLQHPGEGIADFNLAMKILADCYACLGCSWRYAGLHMVCQACLSWSMSLQGDPTNLGQYIPTYIMPPGPNSTTRREYRFQLWPEKLGYS